MKKVKIVLVGPLGPVEEEAGVKLEGKTKAEQLEALNSLLGAEGEKVVDVEIYDEPEGRTA